MFLASLRLTFFLSAAANVVRAVNLAPQFRPRFIDINRMPLGRKPELMGTECVAQFDKAGGFASLAVEKQVAVILHVKKPLV